MCVFGAVCVSEGGYRCVGEKLRRTWLYQWLYLTLLPIDKDIIWLRIWGGEKEISLELKTAQLFSTNAFSANAFSVNVLSTFTAIHPQSIVYKNNFFIYFYQRKRISLKWHRIYYNQTDSLRAIRLEVLGLNVLVLNSCAFVKQFQTKILNVRLFL